jgi:hypothetical protein
MTRARMTVAAVVVVGAFASLAIAPQVRAVSAPGITPDRYLDTRG